MAGESNEEDLLGDTQSTFKKANNTKRFLSKKSTSMRNLTSEERATERRGGRRHSLSAAESEAVNHTFVPVDIPFEGEQDEGATERRGGRRHSLSAAESEAVNHAFALADIPFEDSHRYSIADEHHDEKRLNLLEERLNLLDDTKKSSFKKAKRRSSGSFNNMKQFKSKKSTSMRDLFSDERTTKRRGARRRHSLSNHAITQGLSIVDEHREEKGILDPLSTKTSNHSSRRRGKRQSHRKSRSNRRLQITDKAKETVEKYLEDIAPQCPNRYRSFSEPPTDKMHLRHQLPNVLYWL